MSRYTNWVCMMKKNGKATKLQPMEDVRKDRLWHYPAVTAVRGTCKKPGCKGKIHEVHKMKGTSMFKQNQNCFLEFIRTDNQCRFFYVKFSNYILR